MRAVQINEYGSVEKLELNEIAVPEINSDDLLIKVKASSINPVDWKIREGYLQEMIPYEMPLTLGWDVAGVVEKVGADVSEFSVGDEVFSRPDIARNGTYVDYIL